MEWTFEGLVIYWRGPAPFYFIQVPERVVADLAPVAKELTYGWGCIPATVTVGQTTYATSLFPKDGGFLVPVKVAVRRAEGVDEGDEVVARLVVGA